MTSTIIIRLGGAVMAEIVDFEPVDAVTHRVAKNLFIGFYLNSAVVSLVLAGFKLGGAITAGWQWVLMPLYLPLGVVALMFAGAAENAARFSRRRLSQ